MDEKTFLLSQSIRSNDFEGEGEGGTTYTLTEGTTRGESGRKIYTSNKRSVHVESRCRVQHTYATSPKCF